MKPGQLELFPETNRDLSVASRARRGAPPIGPRMDASTVCGLLVPFPSDRLFAYVRLIARAMDGREERLAQKYLRTERSRLIARLQAQGFQMPVAMAEAELFAAAVLKCRKPSGRRRSPGGAL